MRTARPSCPRVNTEVKAGARLSLSASGQILNADSTGIGPRPAGELVKRLPARAWQRISAGPGVKAPRWYDWAVIEAADPAATGGGPHWLLIRRSISNGQYAFYRS